MLKKIIYLIALIGVFNLLNVSFAYTMKGNAESQRIPRGTVIELKMEDAVSTSSNVTGDMLTASTKKDIVVNKTVVLPQGTIVRGTVSTIIPKKRLSRSAILHLNFDHVVTASGKHVPIKAALRSDSFVLTNDGAIAGGGNYGTKLKLNWKNTKDIVKKSTMWGVNYGDNLFKGGKFLVTPISATGGAIAGGVYYVYSDIADLFRKGNDINVNQGKDFSILLLDNLDIPSY